MAENNVTVTGFSGLFDTILPTGLTLTGTRNLENRLTRLMRNRGMHVNKELILTLLGASAGSTAAATRTRADYNDVTPGEPVVRGGVVPLEAEVQINRATTAGDVTQLSAILNDIFYPSSYPVDVSGNGGGGKVGVL